MAIGPLEAALHQQDDTVAPHGTLYLIQVGSHDDVHQSPLVLQGEEDEPLGCGRGLPGAHHPRHPHAASGLCVLQRPAGYVTSLLHVGTK